MKIKKIARRVQAECGVKYTTALAFVREHHETIFQMTVAADGDGVAWTEQPGAACSLWRELNATDN